VNRIARILVGDDLAFDVGLMLQGQHDSAYHRGEQNQPRSLEEVKILRVDDLTERRRVRNIRPDADRRCTGRGRRHRPGADDQHELDEHADADQRADRQILQESFLQLGKVDVEHHDHEQEQHRDGADVNDDEDHRQELGPGDHEQAGRIDESHDKKQHRVNRIARDNHDERGGDHDRGEEIEERGGEIHERLGSNPSFETRLTAFLRMRRYP
jgi:hypothetical protein